MKCECLAPIYLLARPGVRRVQAGLACPGKTQRKTNTLGYFLLLFGDRILSGLSHVRAQPATLWTRLSKVFQITVLFKCRPCCHLFNKPCLVSRQLLYAEDIIMTEQQQVCTHTLFQIQAYILVTLLFQISSLYAFPLFDSLLSLCTHEPNDPHITMETELTLNDNN